MTLQGCDWLPSATHRKYFHIFSSSVVDSHSSLLQDQWDLWLAQLPKGMLWLDDLSKSTFFFGMEKNKIHLWTHTHGRMYVCVRMCSGLLDTLRWHRATDLLFSLAEMTNALLKSHISLNAPGLGSFTDLTCVGMAVSVPFTEHNLTNRPSNWKWSIRMLELNNPPCWCRSDSGPSSLVPFLCILLDTVH